MRGLLPEAARRSMEEQLSGSCTVEIAAFDEFSGLIGDPNAAKAYDHVIFDTAPTGHTLRLMSLAKAWDQFLDKNTSGTSCLGPLAGLEKQRGIYEATVNTLADATATRYRRIRPARRLAGLQRSDVGSLESGGAAGARSARFYLAGTWPGPGKCATGCCTRICPGFIGLARRF
jgi:arsenite-transporting ATPase